MLSFYSIIVANVLISLWGFQAFKERKNEEYFLFIPNQLKNSGNFPGVFLSNFSHGSMMHLFFNMLTLYFFGPAVAQNLGEDGFLLVYGTSLLGASGLVYLIRRDNPEYRCLGASGGVSGIILASIILNPGIKIYLMFIPIGIPGPLFVVLYLAGSALLVKKQAGGISHEAHIGGAIGGFLAGAVLAPQGLESFLQYFRDLLS